MPKVFSGEKLAHLSWNPVGNELVVADIYGRICIFQTIIAMNRLSASKGWMSDPKDHRNNLAGMIWLNPDRPVRMMAQLVIRPQSNLPDRLQRVKMANRTFMLQHISSDALTIRPENLPCSLSLEVVP